MTMPPLTGSGETPQAVAVEEIHHAFAAIDAAPVAGRVIDPVLPFPTMQATPVALEPIVLPPDLELIETHPDKLRTAARKVEPPQPPPAPRVRPPLPPISDEPLVQVDTRKV